MKDISFKRIVKLLIINLVIATVLCIAIVWLIFSGINSYTAHGIYETVPDLRESYVEEAKIMLSQQKLLSKVIDSVYIRDKALGTVIEQIPAPGSSIKQNRPVYLVINSRQIKKVPLPQINDFSLRQATTALYANGLNVSKVEYAPSEYKDLVLDVIYKGESIFTGYPVEEGDSVLLVVGAGLNFEKSKIPNLRGLTIEEARQSLIASAFVIGATHYDSQIVDGENSFIIYKQEPPAGEELQKGTAITIWLSNDHNLLNRSKDQETNDEEEEFF